MINMKRLISTLAFAILIIATGFTISSCGRGGESGSAPGQPADSISEGLTDGFDTATNSTFDPSTLDMSAIIKDAIPYNQYQEADNNSQTETNNQIDTSIYSGNDTNYDLGYDYGFEEPYIEDSPTDPLFSYWYDNYRSEDYAVVDLEQLKTDRNKYFEQFEDKQGFVIYAVPEWSFEWWERNSIYMSDADTDSVAFRCFYPEGDIANTYFIDYMSDRQYHLYVYGHFDKVSAPYSDAHLTLYDCWFSPYDLSEFLTIKE